VKEYKLRNTKPAVEPEPFTDDQEAEVLGKAINDGLPPIETKDAALEEEKQPSELTEEFLEKYATDKLRYKALEASLEKRKDTILGLSGREVGIVQIGKAIIKKTTEPGKTSVDWEKWLKMLIADNLLDQEVVEKLAKDKDLVKTKKQECGWIKRGKDGIRLGVDIVA
jgi:hypothetical protein